MRTCIVALVVTAAAVVAAPLHANASTRVAVAAFDGDRTGDLQDVVIELLESDYAIVDRRKVMKSIEKLELDDVDNNKALAKIAKDLDADAVVVGEVEPDGSKSKLTMRVYVAATKRAFKVNVRFSTARQIRDSELRRELRDVLGEGDGGGSNGDRGGTNGDRDRGGDDDGRGGDDRGGGKRSFRDDGGGDDDDRGDDDRGGDDDDRGDDDRGRDDDDDRGKRGKRGKRTARGGDDDDDRGDDDDGISEGATAASGGRNARKAAIRVEVGASGTGRKLTFIHNLEMDQAPPGYASNLVPGARVAVELYPLALQNPNGAAAGIGVSADFDQALGLTTTSSLAPDSPLTTTSRMFAVGVRYRIAYGTSPTSPSFTLGIGYGQRKFTVDRAPLMGQNLDLPNVVYKYLDPYLAIRVPVHPSAAIGVSGRFLAMRSTGAIGEDDQYGLAKVTGVDLSAGMEFQLGKYVLIHFAGVFTQVGYTFDPAGAGDLARNRDGNPDDLDVGGARDRYIGAMGTVGVVY
jgi:hypothetical protein